MGLFDFNLGTSANGKGKTRELLSVLGLLIIHEGPIFEPMPRIEALLESSLGSSSSGLGAPQ